jgi:hypothetical protein
MQATAVIAMLEKRAGEELFRKHVATVVAGALAALHAEQLAAEGAAEGGDASPPQGAAGKAAGRAYCQAMARRQAEHTVRPWRDLLPTRRTCTR